MLLIASNSGRFFADHAPSRIDDDKAHHRAFEGIIGHEQRGPAIRIQRLDMSDT
jgi:hypothetical protein